MAFKTIWMTQSARHLQAYLITAIFFKWIAIPFP